MGILEELSKILVELGRTIIYYSGVLPEYIAGLTRGAFSNLGMAWYVAALAIVILGVLYWVNRL